MKRVIAICLALAALAATADTNELERARLAYLEARKAYMAAREAAGLTNAPRRKVAVGATSATIFTKSQKKFFENRRICISRTSIYITGSSSSDRCARSPRIWWIPERAGRYVHYWKN